MVTGIAAAGLLITLTGVRTRRTRRSVVVARSRREQTEAEPVAVRD